MPSLDGVELPLLPTQGVGSHASPAWLITARRALRTGEAGPADLEEALEDAVRIAVSDQQQAGLDVLTDGEMARQRFLWNIVERLHGLRVVPPRRKLGVMSYDSAPHFETVERVRAPAEGLGLVTEWQFLRTLTDAPAKICCPGPLTLALPIVVAGGYPPGDDLALLHDLADIVNAELRRLVAAGATFIQIDEPSAAGGSREVPVAETVKLFNRTVAGVNAKIALHLCFGNNQGRPGMKRSYRPLFPAMLDAHADQFALEFANREMAELGLWREIGSERELAAGVIDVKSMYLESAADVAERIRLVLRHCAPQRLWLTCDCGFSASSRPIARAKLKALVDGAAIVRRELAGDQ
jgi:5-methyltetrahydropteroyltriglutamate--homocysteine methyltransferase